MSDLHLVDAVASENGAAICFRTANTRVIWRILREQLCSISCELKESFAVGRSIIDADSNTAPRNLAILNDSSRLACSYSTVAA